MAGRTSEREELLVRYLLGELPAGERTRLEEDYFAEAGAFERLLAAEDELIDDYVRGGLNARERELFESRFLTNDRRRERVEFARALRGALARERAAAAPAPDKTRSSLEAGASPWWRRLLPFPPGLRTAAALSAAAVLLALLAGLVWLNGRGVRRRDAVTEAGRDTHQGEGQASPAQTAPTPETRPTEANSDKVTETAGAITPQDSGVDTGATSRAPHRTATTPPQSPAPPPPSSLPTVVSFLLTPNVNRGLDEGGGTSIPLKGNQNNTQSIPTPPSGLNFPAQLAAPEASFSGNRLTIPAGAKVVRLQVALAAQTAGAYQNYRASVETVEGGAVWKRAPVAAPPRGTSASIVTVSLPARVLRTGGYFLRLRGVNAAGAREEIGEYYFSVIKQ
jgi:hypothetical protein